MELRKTLSFQKFIALFCLLFAIFCFVQGLKPVEATSYDIMTRLAVPSVNLDVDVAKIQLINHELKTPDTIVGSFSRAKNKTLLIGHSTTAFKRLENVKLGDEIFYNGNIYTINNFVILKESNIDMNVLLRSEKVDTIVLMTCAGELYDDGGASHRLIVTATSE